MGRKKSQHSKAQQRFRHFFSSLTSKCISLLSISVYCAYKFSNVMLLFFYLTAKQICVAGCYTPIGTYFGILIEWSEWDWKIGEREKKFSKSESTTICRTQKPCVVWNTWILTLIFHRRLVSRSIFLSRFCVPYYHFSITTHHSSAIWHWLYAIHQFEWFFGLVPELRHLPRWESGKFASQFHRKWQNVCVDVCMWEHVRAHKWMGTKKIYVNSQETDNYNSYTSFQPWPIYS